MTPTLTARSLLRQRIRSLPRFPSISLRSIHDLHIVLGDSPDGLTRLWGYRRIPFPKLAKQKICLWKGRTKLGVMDMPKVMSEYLGPGKLLNWRPSDEVSNGSDSRSRRKAGDSKGEPPVKPGEDVLDYGIVDISHPMPSKKFYTSLGNKEAGLHNVILRCNHPPTASLERTTLAGAYHLLGSPTYGTRHPVKFHVRLPPEDPSRHRVQWAVRNRVDLYPEVIMRAMPEGVRCTTFPRIRTDGWNLIWSCVAQHYDPLARQVARAARHLQGEEGKAKRPSGKEAWSRPKLSGERADGAELKEKFEQALKKALKKQRAHIRVNHEKDLRKVVKRRLEKDPGSPHAPLPEETAKMKKRMEAAIERAMAKVRASVEYDFGIEPAAAAAVEDDPVGESEGVVSSKKTRGKPS